MRRQQKILVTVLWGLTVLAMLGVVGTGLWARRQSPLEVLYDAPEFALIDQNGQPVTQETLRGNVWVAMVFFASCPGVCPMMTARMAELQQAVPQPDVKIVSISIDPEHDTPEMLRGYAQGMGADQSRWYFLTGEKDALFQTARGLKLAATPAQDGQPITHTQKVLLIDRSNRIRGVYDTAEDESMMKLAEDAQNLAAQTRGSAS